MTAWGLRLGLTTNNAKIKSLLSNVFRVALSGNCQKGPNDSSQYLVCHHSPCRESNSQTSHCISFFPTPERIWDEYYQSLLQSGDVFLNLVYFIWTSTLKSTDSLTSSEAKISKLHFKKNEQKDLNLSINFCLPKDPE